VKERAPAINYDLITAIANLSPGIIHNAVNTAYYLHYMFTVLFLDQELIPYRLSSCSCTCAFCYGNVFQKESFSKFALFSVSAFKDEKLTKKANLREN